MQQTRGDMTDPTTEVFMIDTIISILLRGLFRIIILLYRFQWIIKSGTTSIWLLLHNLLNAEDKIHKFYKTRYYNE